MMILDASSKAPAIVFHIVAVRKPGNGTRPRPLISHVVLLILAHIQCPISFGNRRALSANIARLAVVAAVIIFDATSELWIIDDTVELSDERVAR